MKPKNGYIEHMLSNPSESEYGKMYCELQSRNTKVETIHVLDDPCVMGGRHFGYCYYGRPVPLDSHIRILGGKTDGQTSA